MRRSSSRLSSCFITNSRTSGSRPSSGRSFSTKCGLGRKRTSNTRSASNGTPCLKPNETSETASPGRSFGVTYASMSMSLSWCTVMFEVSTTRSATSRTVDSALRSARMPPPRLAVAAHERLLVGLEEHDFHDVAALAQRDQRVEEVTEVLTFPDVDAEGHAVALVARSGDEIGEGRHERGRQVVDTEEPHVFEALDRVRLAGSTQARDDHEGDRLRHGWRGGQRRFGANRRWCDGRIPSSSRYFATVRRAMVSPRPLRINATSWSESGFDGSSLASRSWIIFFTETDETISPSPEAMPEWKKNFSSNSPCGVSTYLLVVTRLIVDSCMPMSSPTSRRDSGLRCGNPRSRKSRWNLTIDCVTFRSVRCRWSTLLI